MLVESLTQIEVLGNLREGGQPDVSLALSKRGEPVSFSALPRDLFKFVVDLMEMKLKESAAKYQSVTFEFQLKARASAPRVSLVTNEEALIARNQADQDKAKAGKNSRAFGDEFSKRIVEALKAAEILNVQYNRKRTVMRFQFGKRRTARFVLDPPTLTTRTERLCLALRRRPTLYRGFRCSQICHSSSRRFHFRIVIC